MASTSEPNGSYPFEIAPLNGFQARPAGGTAYVHGEAVTIPVEFVPERTMFPAVWQESGLWSSVAWWVEVDGSRVNATGAWTTALLLNGTHTYSVGDSGGFAPSPRSGSLFVAGFRTNISVAFLLPTFPVRVASHGLPADLRWELRISDTPIVLASNPVQLLEPNGTYTWDVAGPLGFRPVETHGNLTVTAGPANLTILFVPDGPGPRLAAGLLEIRAATVAGTLGLAGIGSFLVISRVRRPTPPERVPQPPR
ncbi:MAG: hypothetical protein L3J96_06180 [Thermoplasmata archaeon]|nr:hypothetical protein [Thermoplasmata archaeon]